MQCLIFKASDRSRILSLMQITHLRSDLSLVLMMIIVPVTRPRGMWHQLAAKHEGQFQQEAPLYYFSLAMGGRMVVTTDLYRLYTGIDQMQACMSCLQHARGWSHEATKNVLNANKMTDIVSYVFRCTYVIQMFTRR